MVDCADCVGMNYAAQPLTVAEIERMVASPSETRNRVVRSYQLMLDFYGMQIADEATGRIERTPGFRKRYDNLTRSLHNYLRISRICKALGELGHARYVAPWLLFILAEQSEHHELDNSSLRVRVHGDAASDGRSRLWTAYDRRCSSAADRRIFGAIASATRPTAPLSTRLFAACATAPARSTTRPTPPCSIAGPGPASWPSTTTRPCGRHSAVESARHLDSLYPHQPCKSMQHRTNPFGAGAARAARS